MHPPYIYISTLQTTRRVLQIVVIACCPLPCPSSFASSGYIMLESGQLFYLSAPTEKCLVAVFSSPHPHPPSSCTFAFPVLASFSPCSPLSFQLNRQLSFRSSRLVFRFFLHLPPLYHPSYRTLHYPHLFIQLPLRFAYLSFFFFFLLFSRLFSSACFPEVLFSRVILRARLRQNSPRIPTLSLSP